MVHRRIQVVSISVFTMIHQTGFSIHPKGGCLCRYAWVVTPYFCIFSVYAYTVDFQYEKAISFYYLKEECLGPRF